MKKRTTINVSSYESLILLMAFRRVIMHFDINWNPVKMKPNKRVKTIIRIYHEKAQ
jgi:hypothetical protein